MSKVFNRKNILLLLILIVITTIIFSCFNTQKTTSLLSFITKREESEVNTSVELETLTISGFESEYIFDSQVNSYDIEIFENTYYLNIRAVPKSESATVEVVDNIYFGTNSGTVKVIVSNFDNTNTYLINWTKVDKSTVSYIKNFTYTKKSQTFTVPFSGNYKIEAWGAQGGAACLYPAQWTGGLGAYTEGEIDLTKNSNLYIFVGQKGSDCTTVTYGAYTPAAWNGGGSGAGSSDSNDGGGSGGGASDIRIINTSEVSTWNEADSLRSRIMVAAGGAGAAYINPSYSYRATGGGGVTGTGVIRGYNNQYISNHSYHGTQTSGYAFGQGQNGFPYAGGGGGGGSAGWYGGYAIKNENGFPTSANYGASGSSYISGHTGCVGVTSTESSSPKSGCLSNTTDNSCSLSPYDYSFNDTIMIDGDGYGWSNVKNNLTSMPNPNGGNYSNGNGHTGDGYVRISYLENISNYNYLDSITFEGGTLATTLNKLETEYTINIDSYLLMMTMLQLQELNNMT